ncbi:hypothetical protein [Streptomyces mirabilis]
MSRRVIVAASDRRRTPPNVWVTLRLRDVVQLRSRFTTDHNYPRLAQDLVAAYSEKMSQDVGSMGSRYTNYPKTQKLMSPVEDTMVVYKGAFEDTVEFTYTCAGSGAAHGTMSVWLPGFGGTFSCISKRSLPPEVTVIQKAKCGSITSGS